MSDLEKATLKRMEAVFINNLSTLRRDALRRWFDPPNRDYNKEFGYPDSPQSAHEFRRLYTNNGIARRVVNVYPRESWALKPEVYETSEDRKTTWERRWNELMADRRLNPWHYLLRADVLSGIGRFGVLLLGFDDGKELSLPVDGIDEAGNPLDPRPEGRKLIYMRPFSEDLVQVADWNTNPTSPRFGQPTAYNINLYDPVETDDDATISGGDADNTQQRVHWTRIIHLTDDPSTSAIASDPRCQPVLPYLLDIRKVGGSSAEMFWRGAFPGYSVESFPELAREGEIDVESVKKQMQLMTDGLQRYVAMVGMTVKSLAPQVADPTNHLTQYLHLICATIEVPLRIFMGSESGHLASTQDAEAWKGRLKNRQEDYLSPFVIHPFVHRLMCVGVLPWVDEYVIDWPDLNTMSTKDLADVGLKLTQALLQYVTSGCEKVVTIKHWLTYFMKFSDGQADAMLEAAKKSTDPLTRDLWDKALLLEKQAEMKMETNAANSQVKAEQDRITAEQTNTRPTQQTGVSGRRNSLTGASTAQSA